MDRKSYNDCIGKNMKGKKLSKEQRKLEFCIVAKMCSGKVPSREEADRVCQESARHPKEPKARSSKKGGGQSCEKDVLQTARCMVDVINMEWASNVNSVEAAIANAMMECRCGKN